MPYVGKKPENIIATAVDSTTGTFSGAVSAASVDADGGVTIDNITIDGTEIDLSSGDLTLDVAGDIILDADGQQIFLKNDGTHWGTLLTNGTPQHFYIDSKISDGDLIFRGDDGGAAITALTLDMSDAGTAIFNHDAKITSGNIQFGASGSETGQIEINSSRLLQRSTGDASGLRFDGSAYTPFKNGSQANGTVDIGSSGARYKDLYLSGNVYIGGTGSSNAFDDYEEGTFETTVGPSTSGTVTLTSSENTLSYTKIGRKVSILGAISVNAVSSPVGTFVSINNLPFTIGDLTELAGRGSASITFNDNTVSGSDSFEAEGSLLIEGESRIRVYRDASTVAGGDHFYISATYFTS